jgi:hypothetical protein
MLARAELRAASVEIPISCSTPKLIVIVSFLWLSQRDNPQRELSVQVIVHMPHRYSHRLEDLDLSCMVCVGR